MIRTATIEDMSLILRMAERFVVHYGLASYEEETCRDMVTGMLSMDTATILVGDHGMIGGMVYPHFFNRNRLMAQELFWWVDPEYRNGREGLRLITAFEKWARSQGAHRIAMVCLPVQRSVGRFYERRGYRPLESAYVRDL